MQLNRFVVGDADRRRAPQPRGNDKSAPEQQGSRYLVVLRPKLGVAVQCNRSRQAV